VEGAPGGGVRWVAALQTPVFMVLGFGGLSQVFF